MRDVGDAMSGPKTYEQLAAEVARLEAEKAELLVLVSAVKGGEDKWYLMLSELIKAVTKDINENPPGISLSRTHELLKAWTP